MDRELELVREEFGEAAALQASPVTTKETEDLKNALLDQWPRRRRPNVRALLADLDRLYRHQGEMFDAETGEIKLPD